MTIAFSSVPRALAPMATSSFNVAQRVAASLGTAVLAVVLQQRIQDRLPADASPIAQLVPGSDLAKGLAASFGQPFWWALVFTALAVLPCLLLPGRAAVPLPAADGGKEAARKDKPTREPQVSQD